MQEVIDEDDAKLKQLRSEGSRDAYEAVVNAVAEMNEYNPSGRYPVLELWNNKEKRKASLEEIVQYIIKQLKASNSKRKRVHFVWSKKCAVSFMIHFGCDHDVNPFSSYGWSQ